MKKSSQYISSVIISLFILLSLNGEARSQILIENESSVDVTPSGFSVVWQTSENAVPGISVFSDPDGNEEITNRFETVLYPLHGGNPAIIGEYARDEDMDNIRLQAKSRGLMKIRVEGCLPETTYYYRISSEEEGGEIASWPIGSLASVTTTSENSFVADSRQIVVNINDNGEGLDLVGMIVTASSSDTLFGVSSFVGDGALPNQAYINLSNLFGVDGRNWTPIGAQEISLEIMMGRGADIVFQTLNVDFSVNFSISRQNIIDIDVLTAGAIVISNITQDRADTGDITITWGSKSGREYEIVAKDSFGSAFIAVDTVTASGDSSSWTDDGLLTGAHPSTVKERYYKVFQPGLDSSNIVGMFKITVADGMNLISLPLIPFSTALEDVIGTQIFGADNEEDSDRVWVWNGTNYEFAWQVGGVGSSDDGKWFTGNNPATITLSADQGAWIEIRPGNGPVDITLLGRVSKTNRTISLIEGMNLIGTTFPVSVSLANTNIWESGFSGGSNEGDADRVWIWEEDHYEFIWLVDGVDASFDGQWFNGNIPAERSLEPGRGYLLQRRERPVFEWDYKKPY